MTFLLPNTRFFEMDSAIVGATYGVWVTTPSSYEGSSDRRYPAIFMPDANLFAPVTIPFVGPLGDSEFISPIVPFIQVTVGYVGEDAKNALTVRNRDLLPTGEPPSPYLIAQMRAAVASGKVSAEVFTEFQKTILSGKAHAFLRFLTEELYPAVATRWRLDPASTGLWGDSYGGLFTAWAAMQRPPTFPRIGAGSPGIMTLESKVFELLEQEIASRADHSGRHLHVSICQTEFTHPAFYQDLARSYAHFMGRLGASPLKGLKLTTHMVPFESHLTGSISNWFSFLRACYAA